MPVHENGDAVNHPQHYNAHPSGVECIDVVRHMNFNVGNAIKYLWRSGLKSTGRRKSDKSREKIEDIQKAIWYLNDEIARLQSEQGDATIDSAVVVAATVQASPPPSLAIPEKAEEDDPPFMFKITDHSYKPSGSVPEGECGYEVGNLGRCLGYRADHAS